MGRPRKIPKLNHFFDYACRNKRQKKKGQKSGKSSKNSTLKTNGQLLSEPGSESTIFQSSSTLEKQILEASENMGLQITTDRSDFLQKITDQINAETMMPIATKDKGVISWEESVL